MKKKNKIKIKIIKKINKIKYIYKFIYNIIRKNKKFK